MRAAARAEPWVGALALEAPARGGFRWSGGSHEAHPGAPRGLLRAKKEVRRGADPHVMDYAGFNAAWWAKAASSLAHVRKRRSSSTVPS